LEGILLGNQVYREELKRRWKLRRWARWAKIPGMTFPIKKRINTELFIDRNNRLFIQKGDKEMDQENILIKKRIGKYLNSWRMVKLKWREWKHNCLFGMTNQQQPVRKDWATKAKNIVEWKMGYLSKKKYDTIFKNKL